MVSQLFRQFVIRDKGQQTEMVSQVGNMFRNELDLLCVKARLPTSPYPAVNDLDTSITLEKVSNQVIHHTDVPGLYTRTCGSHDAVKIADVLLPGQTAETDVFCRNHVDFLVGQHFVYGEEQDMTDQQVRRSPKATHGTARRLEATTTYLDEICSQEIKGVTSPMYYFCASNTTSSVHVEAYFLCSVSYLLPGSCPKYWLIFDVRHLLFVNEHIPPTADDCAYPVYKNNHFVDTEFLDSCNIDYMVVKQEPGEILFTNVRCAHQVFNAGRNVSVGKNWCYKGWQMEARRIPRCLCFHVSNGWRFLYKELYEIELEMYAGGSRVPVGQLQVDESDEELIPCTQISVDESDDTCTLLANDDSGYCDLSGETGDDGGQETLAQTQGGRISTDAVTRFGLDGIDQELNAEATFSPHADTRVDFPLLDPLQQGQDEYGYEDLLEGSDCVEPGPDLNTNENLFNSGAIRQHTVSRSIPDTVRHYTVSRSATPRATSNAADNSLSCIREKIEKTRKQTKERYGRGKQKQVFKKGRDKCVDRTAHNLSQRKSTANKEIANVVAAKRRTSDTGELDELDRQISELQKKVVNISEQMFMHRVLKKIFPSAALKKRASELYTGFDIARDYINSTNSAEIQRFWIEVDRVLALPATDPELAKNCVAWMHAFRIKGWDRIPAMDKPVRI